MTRLDEAIQKLDQGKLKEGQEILEDLRREEPDNPVVLYNLGMCYSEQGKLEASIEALEHCLEVAPDYTNAYAALGFSYARNGQTEKAVEILEEARKKEPENIFVLKNLGSVYGNLGRIDEAIESFKRAQELQPESPEILYGLAYAYEQRGEMSNADRLYQRIIEIGGSDRFVDLAKEGRTRIGVDALKEEGLRPDAVFYCLASLEKYAKMSQSKVREIAFEIGMLGQRGLDIHNPEKKYQLESMQGEFTGLQLLCYMYVGFQLIDPSVDVGADLSDEYQAALSMFEGEISEA
ncbi:MAG: tetratricopeptide repeat protein [bacterium]